MKYIVSVKEIHYSAMEIEADSPEDARDKVADGEGEQIFCEYSDTVDSTEEDPWPVVEAN